MPVNAIEVKMTLLSTRVEIASLNAFKCVMTKCSFFGVFCDTLIIWFSFTTFCFLFFIFVLQLCSIFIKSHLTTQSYYHGRKIPLQRRNNKNIRRASEVAKG